MDSKTFHVPNIGCDGCVSKIQKEVGQIGGVVQVEGDPTTQMVHVQWQEPASWHLIKEWLMEMDYAPAEDSA